MRIIAKFEKGEAVRFTSHLDVQRLFQRAFRRAKINLAYSQGFNPHPLLSFATALAVGYTSEAEWLDVRLAAEMDIKEFIVDVNAALPKGFNLLEAIKTDDKLPALTAMMSAAEYKVIAKEIDNAKLAIAVDKLLANDIIVEKKTKAGLKSVNIRPQVFSINVAKSDADADLSILGVLNAAGSLNIELLMREVKRCSEEAFEYRVHRKCIYSNDGVVMPVIKAVE